MQLNQIKIIVKRSVVLVKCFAHSFTVIMAGWHPHGSSVVTAMLRRWISRSLSGLFLVAGVQEIDQFVTI